MSETGNRQLCGSHGPWYRALYYVACKDAGAPTMPAGVYRSSCDTAGRLNQPLTR